MKNEAIAGADASPGPQEAWAAALRRFDRELQRRGAAERTRRAYGADCGELARWAAGQGLAPHDVGHTALRRWAARASSAGTEPRRLASARAFFRVLVEDGELHVNPAEANRTPKPHELARLLDRIPATTPLELRDRAMFELAHGCGLRAEELMNLDLRSVEFDAGQLRALGRGSRTRFVPAGELALRSVGRYLERARPALAGDAQEPALFLSKSGRRLSTSDIRRRLGVWARHAAAQGAHQEGLRRSSATHLFEGAADPSGARDRFGRGPISTTQVDTRVESARLRAAYERSHPRA